MIIKDFLKLGVDAKCFMLEVYDIGDGELVFSGIISDCQDRYKEWTIESWNVIQGGICFNVDCGELYNK